VSHLHGYTVEGGGVVVVFHLYYRFAHGGGHALVLLCQESSGITPPGV
jgi:hypothetical protein